MLKIGKSIKSKNMDKKKVNSDWFRLKNVIFFSFFTQINLYQLVKLGD